MTLPENVLAQARGHWRTMLVASHCNVEWSFELSLKFLGGVVADTLGWRKAVRWLENFSPDLGYKTVGLSGSTTGHSLSKHLQEEAQICN